MKKISTSRHFSATALVAAALLGLTLAACETETAGLPGRRPARAVVSPTISSSPMQETLGPDAVFPLIEADFPKDKNDTVHIHSPFADLNRAATQPATQPATRPASVPEPRKGTIDLVPTGTRPAQ